MYPHIEEKVSVIAHQPMAKKHKPEFNLVTPFAGKTFCLNNYVKGIKTLPLENAHAVFYDNSNQPRFQNRLKKILNDHFKSWTLVEDKNECQTIDKTDHYKAVSWRCHNVYKDLYHNRIEDLPLSLNIEDDVQIPDISWNRLTRLLREQAEVGTAVGSCSSRRLKDSTACRPILFDIDVTENITTGEKLAVARRLVTPKPFGVEAVSASHMGLWLTRTSLIRKVGMQWDTDGLLANDICWGYNLNRAGYKTAVDWSVKTKHYFMHNGKKEYV
jgi:hypothetical protein